MAKYDAVDRLMSLAAGKATAKVPPVTGESSTEAVAPTTDAEATLEAKVSAGERGVPFATAPSAGSAATGQPRASSVERGRQLLGALRPFLPVVGGALRMVDHGAVQAVARMLPLLSGAAGLDAAASSRPKVAEERDQLGEAFSAFDKRHAAFESAIKALDLRADTQEELVKRVREGQERVVIEQGALSHRLNQLADRSRLLTAAVIILLMLVVAEMILTVIFMHR